MKNGEVAFGLVSGGIGGGQGVALSVARALTKAGYPIAALAPDDGPLLAEFRRLGARVMITGSIRSLDVRLVQRLAHFLRSTAIVYTHTVPVHETIFAAAAKRNRCRLVLHRHIRGQFSPHRLRGAMQTHQWRATLRRADQVIAVAGDVAQQVRTVSGRTAVVALNGIPIPSVNPRRAKGTQPFRVGFVGRLDRNKRVEDFVAAAALVRAREPVEFVIVGGGVDSAYETALRKQAHDVGLGAGIFQGPAINGVNALRSLDIVVLPSQLEGHPIVLLEAMALERAIVATDISGNRESIRDDVEGKLVPVGRPKDLAAAVDELLADPSQRERLGRAARTRVIEEFSEEAMIGRLMPLVLGHPVVLGP